MLGGRRTGREERHKFEKDMERRKEIYGRINERLIWRIEVGVRGGRFDCLYFLVCYFMPLNYDNLKVRHCIYQRIYQPIIVASGL